MSAQPQKQSEDPQLVRVRDAVRQVYLKARYESDLKDSKNGVVQQVRLVWCSSVAARSVLPSVPY